MARQRKRRSAASPGTAAAASKEKVVKPEVAWVAAYLKNNGETPWEGLKAEAEKAGVALKPIHYR